MKVKEYLGYIRNIEDSIRVKVTERNSMYSMTQSASLFHDVKVQNAKASSNDKMIKVVEVVEQLNDEIHELIFRKRQASILIDKVGQMNVRLMILLRERYINHKEWNDVAETLRISLQHAYKLHSDAIKLFTPIYNEWKNE